jgi:hypothetical protein
MWVLFLIYGIVNVFFLQRDTLIRYLLDELYHYEEGHGNALRPLQEEPMTSFLSEHTATKPVTAAEITQIMQSQLSILIKDVQDAVISSIKASSTAVVNFGIMQDIKRHGEHDPATPKSLDGPERPIVQAIQAAIKLTDDSPPLPVALHIPRPPRCKKGEISIAWKKAIKDWNESSSTNPYPLKDWPKEWYTGKNRTRFGQAYFNRRLIVTEYERYISLDDFYIVISPDRTNRCSLDDGEFLRKWPQANKGLSALLAAINEQRTKGNLRKSRTSKYGCPEDRYESK